MRTVMYLSSAFRYSTSASGAQAIITHNLRDLRGGELRLGNLRVLTPAQCLEEWK